MNKKPPLFLVVEGIDGSGKTTAVNHIAKNLQQSGQSVKVVRSMGSGEIGHAIRELLLNDYFNEYESSVACCLAILDAYKTAVKYLQQGHNVIMDRFIGTYYAYNATANKEVLAPSIFDTVFIHPDILTRQPLCYIYLDVDVDTAKARMADRLHLTRFDKESEEYYQNLIKGFNEFSTLCGTADWKTINNNQSLSKLHKQLDSILDTIQGV